MFFKNGNIDYDTKKLESYAALLSELGINQLCPNNVNVNARSARLITEELLPELADLAALFRAYGISLLTAIEFSAPMSLGGLDSCDPLEKKVQEWWKRQTEQVYKYIPDFAGFLVKADSEFRVGPMSFGRTQADGANLLARALFPHGGLVYWRCFVYNAQQDWRDTVTDRAMAAYEHFKPLDGGFDATTPEELLLFFHRLPYSYRLKSGKTLIQHIYDTHFEGAEEAEAFIETWKSLIDEVPEDVYDEVERRLARQADNAREWRDVINTFFYRISGIADEKGRKIYV